MSVGNLDAEARPHAPHDPLRALAERLPRVFRFLGVGALGFITDFAVFSILIAHSPQPLLMRIVSIVVATLLTWRLNRALTFDRSGRSQREEAMRYAIVTATAQGTSYAIFSALVLTVLGAMPQVALVIGCLIAAAITYNGHRLFAFAPRVSQ